MQRKENTPGRESRRRYEERNKERLCHNKWLIFDEK